MSFKDVRYRVIRALKDGTYLHAARGSIEDKNALMTGDIPPEDLIKIIDRCNGTHHENSERHTFKGVEVHIHKRNGWYLKFYFIEPDTVFISVHLSR